MILENGLSAKASISITLTDEGIVIPVKFVEKNALSPIVTTVFGIFDFEHPATNLFVAFSIIALQLFLESYTEFSPSTTKVSKYLKDVVLI